MLFIFGFLVLSLQPWLPLNPDSKTLLAPSTIFHSVVSFMTNTDLQHYSGEQHLSNFSQIFFGITNLFVSAAVGLCALIAIIRALRSDQHLGNFFVDMWRVLAYLFAPIAFVIGLIFIQQGCPMTFATSFPASTLEPAALGVGADGQALPQTIALGPVAAFEAIKMLGANGGGFYGMNSAHPFENPTALSNFFNTLAMMLFPFALVLMYGRMLQRFSHGLIIFSVMLLLMTGTVVWSVYFDTLQPNPGLTAHPQTRSYVISGGAGEVDRRITLPAVAGLPVDQHLGNLEGKELRFGVSAGAAFAALTTDVTCGAVNAEADSLNPLAALAPMVGMWLNCIFGGKGVGMINMLLYIVIGIFLAGMMVGRTPEYLGKKIAAREVKLAIIALLIHPLMILTPTGLFSATDWGLLAVSNPGSIEGFASVDESAITGESSPVIRAADSDRTGVTGGTLLLSDRIIVEISSESGHAFLDRMIALVEGAIRQRSPNEIALTLVLSAFSLIFLIVVIPLWAMAWHAEHYMTNYLGLATPLKSLGTDIPTLIALLVCLIPTTIGALLAAIGIAGMDRALQANVIAKSGKAVELAGDVDVVSKSWKSASSS